FVLRRCLRRSKSARGGKYLRSTEGFEKVLCSSDRFRSAFHQQPTEQCDADQEAAVLHGGHPAPLFADVVRVKTGVLGDGKNNRVPHDLTLAAGRNFGSNASSAHELRPSLTISATSRLRTHVPVFNIAHEWRRCGKNGRNVSFCITNDEPDEAIVSRTPTDRYNSDVVARIDSAERLRPFHRWGTLFTSIAENLDHRKWRCLWRPKNEISTTSSRNSRSTTISPSMNCTRSSSVR